MLDFALTGTGPLAMEMRGRGFATFAEVAEYVRGIPYGRGAPRLTCSSKHKLLAALAHECGRTDVALMVGLFEMSERTTPGVGRVLSAAGIDAIPEAHCYLTCDGTRYDFTGLPVGQASPFDSLIEERVVAPDQLAEVKVPYHRAVLARWAVARGLEPDEAWEIRERCIASLSGRSV